MERKLLQAFDRQRFQQNKRLAGIIDDVESRYAHALTDDDLELVSAAGDAEPVRPVDRTEPDNVEIVQIILRKKME